MISARSALAVAVLLATVAAPSGAQTAASLLESGIRAYNDLEFPTAATFLRRALNQPADSLAPATAGRARAYLGASEVFLGNTGVAETIFEQLLLAQPRYRLDELVFPPQVSTVFERVRRRTFVVSLEAARDTTVPVGGGGYSVWVFATSFHRVSADVVDADNALVRALYTGPIADSLEVQWDGQVRPGIPVAPGRYVLRVRSEELSGRAVRRVDLPLDVRVIEQEPLPVPDAPPDSAFRPEHAASGPGLRALLGGIVAGAAVAVLPAVVASSEDLGSARFAAAGGIGLAGVIGFFAQRPGRPLDANIAANEAIRDAWRRRVEETRNENERRAREVRVGFRAAPPRTVPLDGE